jgi:hypothetical protein
MPLGEMKEDRYIDLFFFLVVEALFLAYDRLSMYLCVLSERAE